MKDVWDTRNVNRMDAFQIFAVRRDWTRDLTRMHVFFFFFFHTLAHLPVYLTQNIVSIYRFIDRHDRKPTVLCYSSRFLSSELSESTRAPCLIGLIGGKSAYNCTGRTTNANTPIVGTKTISILHGSSTLLVHHTASLYIFLLPLGSYPCGVMRMLY